MNVRLLFCSILSLLPAASAAGGEYSLDPIGKPAAEGEEPAPQAELPKEIPEPFRAVLNPEGLRLCRAGGEQPLYDLWFRKQVPLRETASTTLSVNYGRLEVGTFMGVLRSYGEEVDYHENPIDKGFYLLRYGLQPTDGDHMGTAASRDFLVLTRFKEDDRLEPVSDMDELIELALSASATGEHPMILFLEKPAAPAAEQYERPRIYRHAERDEWIADIELPARLPDDEAAASQRIGLVLVGVSESF